MFVVRYELEYFYEEQLQRMEQLGIETLPFDDCLCQVRLFPRFFKHLLISFSDARHDPAPEQACHHLEGPEAVQDDAGLLRHLLQLGEIPRPRAERSVCHPERDR